MTTLTPARARKTDVTSAREINALVKQLDLPRFRPMACDPRDNTYLVVDLFDQAGVRSTYRFDGASVYTEDCQTGHEADDAFQRFFERYAP